MGANHRNLYAKNDTDCAIHFHNQSTTHSFYHFPNKVPACILPFLLVPLRMEKKIQSALISVFYKDGLEPLARTLHSLNITIYSTGGTQKFLEDIGIPCVAVETVTGYPSILGGRVKTLHPSVLEEF